MSADLYSTRRNEYNADQLARMGAFDPCVPTDFTPACGATAGAGPGAGAGGAGGGCVVTGGGPTELGVGAPTVVLADDAFARFKIRGFKAIRRSPS